MKLKIRNKLNKIKNKLMEKCVLITGGCGFLGSNLIKKFVLENYAKKIIVVDNFITGNRSNLHKLQSNQNFRIAHEKFDIEIDNIELDICDNKKMYETMVKNYEYIDEIYHFASLASPPFYKKYPLETLDVGYIGMKNMLELCKFYNNKRKCKLLYASTSEVYGDAKEHPQNENYYGNVNSYGARSCYDVSKRVGETLIYTYRELYNLDTRIVRIFNTYGPYMNLNDGRIVTEIMKSKLTNSVLNIYGDGSQTRSLSYVDNTLNLIMIVMNCDYTNPVNVGDDEEININELVKIIKDIKNESKLNVKYIPMEKDDPKVRKPDLTLVKKLIKENNVNYDKISLLDGLKKTFEYFENEVNNIKN